MNKLYIEVKVPTIERKFEMLVPVNKKVSSVIILIQKAINELTEGVYIIKDNAILCDEKLGGVYNHDVLVKDSGLKNGTKVLLI